AGRPAVESLGGGTGVRVGREGRGRRPKKGNDEHVDDLNGQGNDQGMGANGGVKRVNGNVSNRGNVGNKNGNVVNENVQENVENVLVNGNRVGCSCKEFLACNPKECDGKGGTVVLTRWIEKIDNVQDMSGCSIDQKVKYTASSFVGKALTWWNSQIRTLSREVVVSMSWIYFKFIMIQEFCHSHEMQKLKSELWNHVMVGAGHAAYTDRFHELARLVPHLVTLESGMIERYVYGLASQIRGMVASTEPTTIQKAVQISGALTDEVVRNGSIKKVEKRGNMGEPSKDKNGRDDNKRTRTENVFATTVNPVGRENADNDDEVEPIENETTSVLLSKGVGCGPKSLWEQWRETTVDDEYDPYDDIYEGFGICEHGGEIVYGIGLVCHGGGLCGDVSEDGGGQLDEALDIGGGGSVFGSGVFFRRHVVGNVGNTVKNVNQAVKESDSDVEYVYDETAQFMTNEDANDASLFENQDYDIYDGYDIQGLTKEQLAFCDTMYIRLEDQKWCKIVSLNQRAFISGRRIQDNILITQELLKGYMRKQGAKRCAMKIDIQKAYDTVSCEFLKEVLIQVGFHETTVEWIMTCITSAAFSICVNGETYGYFKRGGGLRQGDPISLYLFTLVIEVFNMILAKEIRESRKFKYHYGCKELQLTHMCFADDLLVLCIGDTDSLGVVKKDLDEFSNLKDLDMTAKVLLRMLRKGSVLGETRFLWNDEDFAKGKARVAWSLAKSSLCRSGHSMQNIVRVLATKSFKNNINQIADGLSLCASVRYIWNEINKRMFQNSSRIEDELAGCIESNVGDMMKCLMFKKSSVVLTIAKRWVLK
nr:reverse transcriptase domain-containing protein [Tanacetum cinerariifolium]